MSDVVVTECGWKPFEWGAVHRPIDGSICKPLMQCDLYDPRFNIDAMDVMSIKDVSSKLHTFLKDPNQASDVYTSCGSWPFAMSSTRMTNVDLAKLCEPHFPVKFDNRHPSNMDFFKTDEIATKYGDFLMNLTASIVSGGKTCSINGL